MEKEQQIKTVNEWLNDLSISLGIELKLNEDENCFFQIGESTIIGIEISLDFPMVNIYSPLMVLPDNDKIKNELVLIRALEINAFQALTRGGAIGIAPGGGPLLYCYSTPIEGNDSDSFSKILGGFYEALFAIKDLLAKATNPDTINEPITRVKSSLLNPSYFIKV